MKSVKRITAAFMCIALVLSLFGCSKDDVAPVVKKIDPGIDKIGYTVPYLRSDSLNPYKAENDINISLTTLMYDSLFAVDNTFKAVPQIAESYTHKDTTIKVKLKNITFTDGSVIAPEDVVYSFVLAKQSNIYKEYLTNLTDCSADGISGVVFTLADKNPYEVANLFFPIVKKNGNKDDSSDSYSASMPVGSGRYKIIDDGETKYLAVNKNRLGGYHPKYNKIGLKDISEIASIPNLFTMGEIDFYTESFSDGTFKRYSGNAATKSTTNFTFLGINGDSRPLKDGKVRRAIALLLSRQDFASVAFAGFGCAASTPFNPDFYGLKDCTLPPIKYDKNAAVGLLEDAGFGEIGSAGIRYSEDSMLELSLAVNRGNNFRMAMARSIQQALSKAGIKVNINAMSFDEYISVIEYGGYDMYIGEARLSNSFDLSRFFNEDGSLSYGIGKECESAAKYNQLEEGTGTMQEFLDVFADELPFIPLAYRQAMTVRADKLKVNSKTTVNDYYYNVDEWTVK